MQLPALDPNIVIIAILLVAGIYGVFGGKHRLRVLILSIYVGIVLAEQMGRVVKPYLGGIGQDQVNWLLLGLPILLFGFSRGHHGGKGHDKGAAIANIIVGMAAGALILSSAFHLMPPSGQSDIDGASYLAVLLNQYHLWLLGLLPLVAIVLGLLKTKEKGHH